MQYFNIPNEILDFSLSPDSFKVIVYLHTRPPDWKVWNKKVTDDTGISKNRLAKVWKELLGKNLISRERERYANGSIKGGGFTYKINCIPKNDAIGITENGNTVSDDDIVDSMFEELWNQHKEYRKRFGNTSHGKKSMAKKKFQSTFKAVKKTFNVKSMDDIFNAICLVTESFRKEKYTQYLQNILDPETVVDKIEDLL